MAYQHRLLRLLFGLVVGVATTGAFGEEPRVAAPSGDRLLLEATAQGVQIYACKKQGDSDRWVFVAPEAALFDASGRQIGIHFAGPSWQMADGSKIVGEVAAQASAPEPNAIAWLLLRVKSHEGSGVLSGVSAVRRIDTQGGTAPTTACDTTQARMQYTARYLFYAAPQ
jgi:hypothetical protein